MLRRSLRGRLGWALPLVLLAVAPACKYLPSSCGKGEVVETAPPPPPRATVGVDDVKALANSGKHDEALAMAEKAVADHPDDDAAWRILEQEAIVSGKAGELLDRLDAANPIGGKKVPHQVLRGSLAREAGRPDVMLAAGEAIRADAPMEAAAFLAAAASKGAAVEGAASALPEAQPEPVPAAPGAAAAGQGDAGSGGETVATAEPVATPPTTDAPAPAAAPTPAAPAGPDADVLGFVRYVSAATNDEAAPWKKQADRIKGWRADLVRGQREVERKDNVDAFASFDRAVESGDPRGVILGNLARVHLYLDLGDPKASALGHSAGEAAGWASDAGDAATAEANGTRAADALDAGVTCYLAALQPASAVAAAEGIYKARSDANDARGKARTGLAYARALVAAGRFADARPVAETARGELHSNGLEDAAREAAWLEGWVALKLGRVSEASDAANALSGPRQQALLGVIELMNGTNANLESLIPTSDLMPNEGEMVYEEVGKLAPAESVKWCQRAVEAADDSGNRLLRISSRLCLESALRSSRKSGATIRAELLSLAPEGGGGDPMRAEVAARALLDGERATFPQSESLPPVVAAWRSLATGESPPDAVEDPWAGPIVGWSRGRYHAAQADIDQVYSGYATALGQLPLHRQGALAIDTVLDGSQGIPSGQDLELLKRLQGKGSTGAALAIHEVEHRREAFRRDFRLGRDPTKGLTDDVRDGLRSAVAQVNVGHLLFLAGAGPYPKEAIQALVDAEKKAATEPAFSSVLPSAPPDVDALMKELGSGAAIISYQISSGRVTGVVLSEYGSPIRDLGSADEIIDLAERHRAVLVSAAASSDIAEHKAGDQLRKRLLDPFAFELSGVGRYLVVAPDELLSFPFTTFPEQSDGLRWLAEIRNVSSASTLSLLQDARQPQGDYETNFLGLGSPATKPAEGQETPEVTVPPELVAAEHMFIGGVNSVLTGPECTTEKWKAGAATAQYIHLAEIEESQDGGFKLGDASLSLSDVRATPLTADLVFITAEAPYQIQLARSRAFLEAGAHRVIFTSWTISEKYRTQFVKSFYEAIYQDKTPSGAMREARHAMIAELGREEADDPGIWGSFVLVGPP